MQAMLIEEDAATRAGTAAALSRAGFAVTVAGSLDDAKAAVRRGPVDVLVTPERVGGRLAHAVALLAEWKNPGLGTILLSDRTEDVDEIFDLLPSLRAVLERDAPARTLAHLALAAARWQGAPREDVDPADAAEPRPTTGVAPARAPRVIDPTGSEHPPAKPPAEEPGPGGPATLAAASEAPEVVDRRSAAGATPQPAAASLLARVPSFLRFARPRPAPAREPAPPAPVPTAATSAAHVRRLHLA